MKSIKVCEYSRSRSFHDDLILQDQASGERSQDQWSHCPWAPCLMLRNDAGNDPLIHSKVKNDDNNDFMFKMNAVE